MTELATAEIRIETSTVCNYRCVMCTHAVHTRSRQIMSDALFERIVANAKRELPQLKLCTVSGFGEFAADPNWKRKLELAEQHFERIHVVTNLSLINDDDLPELARLADEIRVSLYAADEDVFQQIHRPAASITLGLIEGRVRKLAALRGEGTTLGLTCCELPENQRQIETWIQRWEGVVDWLEIWQPHNWVEGKGYRSVERERLATCGRPATGPIQVQADGTVNVCCFDFNGKMIIGDLRQQSLLDIVNGPELARIRRLHASGEADQLELCAVCDQREHTAGKSSRLVYSSRPVEGDRVHMTSSGLESLGGEARPASIPVK